MRRMSVHEERRGRVQTVRGLIEPEELGPTLMHEHVLWDVTRPEVRARCGAGDEVEIRLDTVWEINRRSTLDFGNQHNQDRGVALAELVRLKESGGSAVVDLSNLGLDPDPEGLRWLSRESGVHVIQGAGYYVDEYLPEEVKAKSVDELATEMIAQVDEGCWGTTVRAGIIGEIGCMWPLRDFERKSLVAAALAQQATGASINVHPGRHTDAPGEIVDILARAGADIERVVMSHIDRTFFSPGEVLRLADTGCVIEYDFFGIETSYYWFADADLPTDYMRLAYIRALIEHGHGDRIVISHDICTKTRLVTYGGHGYGHIVRNVVPLMRKKGFTEQEIDTILVHTPRRLLTFGG